MNMDKILQLISLEGKVAIITGGNSGIGLGTAKRLAEFGASVIILGLDDKKGLNAEKEILKVGEEAMYLHCDVSQIEECKAAVGAVIEKFGKIDILFNNAGVAVRKNTVDLEPEEWSHAIDVSLKGQYLMAKCVIPHMIKNGGGSIINNGSGWSFTGGENAVVYCAMKGGSLNMTRAMCIDHGKDNIRVNIVCPGDVDTPMLKSESEQLGRVYNQKFKDECANRPLNRLGAVDDVANAVLFFASNLSTWVTGSSLVVDGGGIAGSA
jgi:NAD(P)-dependent dehydrogenase (short-subunit alcohol dehydrogenase family)